MPHIPFHPAIGFGDLMNGSFVVPQNPIRDAGTPLVPSLQATNPNRIMRRPRLAELMNASFVVPQNPLRQALGGIGCSSCRQSNYTLNGIGHPQGLVVQRSFPGQGQTAWPGQSKTAWGRSMAHRHNPMGLGDFSTDFSGDPVGAVTTWLTDPSPFPSIANWLFYGGIALGLDFYFSRTRGGGRSKK